MGRIDTNELELETLKKTKRKPETVQGSGARLVGTSRQMVEEQAEAWIESDAGLSPMTEQDELNKGTP